MSQSDERVRGRGRTAPPSFGRPVEPEPDPEREFTIRGGEAFHLVLHLEVVPTAESLEQLYQSVRAATAQGVRDGYAEAIAALDEGQTAEAVGPDAGDGGPASG